MKFLVDLAKDEGSGEDASLAKDNEGDTGNQTQGQTSGTVSPVLSDNGFERVYLPKLNQVFIRRGELS